jgi:hypothetical protein
VVVHGARLAAVTALAAALALCACSRAAGNRSSSRQGATPSSPAAPAGASRSPSTSFSSQLQTLVGKAGSAEDATFKATYAVAEPGKSTTITFEQKLPDTRVASPQGEFLSSATTSYFCTTAGTATCYSETLASNPLAAIVQIAEPKAVLNALQSAQAQADANAAGYTISAVEQLWNEELRQAPLASPLRCSVSLRGSHLSRGTGYARAVGGGPGRPPRAYSGTGDEAERGAEAKRVGAHAYHLQLANVLLGAAQMEALLCEHLAGGDDEKLRAAHAWQLRMGGVMDPGSETPNPEKLAEFLRWQTLRVGGPLRNIAQDASTGPIPLAAAHAADGLQRLLGVIARGQVPDIEKVMEGIAEMRAARESFEAAIDNIDILMAMLRTVDDLFDE